MMATYARTLQLPQRSFLLLGPRGTGKTTWLRENLSDAKWFDLVRDREVVRLTRDGDLFRQEVEALPRGQERGRLRAIMKVAERASEVLPDWSTIAAACQRKIRVKTEFPWHFELLLDGSYQDETLRIRYELRPRVGIGEKFLGWEDRDRGETSDVLKSPVDPLRAHQIAADRIAAAIREMAYCQQKIPTHESLDRAEERARDTSPRVVYRRRAG